jgi:hypothetical protein
MSHLPEFRPMTMAELARAARQHIGDGQYVLRLCLQFVDDYREAVGDVRATLLSTAPGTTGDPRWDAFLAALAEHLAYHDDRSVPRWVDRNSRFLRRWWFLSDLPSVKAAALAESPAAFRRRGIFLTEDFFARA